MKIKYLVITLFFLLAIGKCYAVIAVKQTGNSTYQEPKSKVKTHTVLPTFLKIKKVNDDENIVLLIFLSFILPPLAVWLKDNKTTSLLFWATLILSLVGLAGFIAFGSFYGVLMLISMILAFSHVLDAF